MTVNFAHCFFEQSGTFRDEFRKLRIGAADYDICNEFGKTDLVGDLFTQIELAYQGLFSIFDEIHPNDLILAFFPCTYFCGQNEMFFCGTNYNYRQLTKAEMLDKIIERSWLRDRYYIMLLKLCRAVETLGLKMIVENPYNAHHYLRFNFPYKPAVIDMNRRLRGDYFKKPTQYLFVNCEPAGKVSLQMDKPMEFVMEREGIERSLISPDYARNFICDHILGIDTGHTQPTLF
jgi:hypothetical protein